MKRFKGKGKKTRAITIKIRVPNAEKRLHKFIDAWKRHIHDEIRIHKDLLSGKRGLEKHLDETISIHARFLKQLKKI
ncbi:MAG: hypothetical protein QXR53_04055 [Candidatus Norongarragalinales archaeon]